MGVHIMIKKWIKIVLPFLGFAVFYFTGNGWVNPLRLFDNNLYFENKINFLNISFFIFGATFLLVILMGILMSTLQMQPTKRRAFSFFILFIIGYAWWNNNIIYHFYFNSHFMVFMTLLKMITTLGQILFFFYYFSEIIKKSILFRTLIYADLLLIVLHLCYSVVFSHYNFIGNEWVFSISMLPLLLLINLISGYRSVKVAWNIFIISNWYEVLLFMHFHQNAYPLLRIFSLSAFIVLLFIVTGIFYSELKNLQKQLMLSSLDSQIIFANNKIANLLHDVKNRLVFLESQYGNISTADQKRALNIEIEGLKERIIRYQGESKNCADKKFIVNFFENQKKQYGIFVDFTYKVEITRALQFSQEEFEMLLNHMLSNAYQAILMKKKKKIHAEVTMKKISVTDNGVGFKGNKSGIHSTHLGMENIRKVAFIHSGKLVIKSKKEVETTVILMFRKGDI